jgi:biotin carboxyl carrier protein
MAYISSVGEKTYTIDTGEDSSLREISINGIKFDIDWRHITPLAADTQVAGIVGGRYNLLISGKSYEVLARRVNKPDVMGYRYEILVAGQRFEIAVEDEREKTLKGSIHNANESGEAIIRAPMPGLVSGLPMDAGTNVERGQTVVILEAMKMENDLASPITGMVKEIKVNKGQTVNQGDALVVVSAQ